MTQYHHSILFESQPAPVTREYTRQPIIIEQLPLPTKNVGTRVDKITLSHQAQAQAQTLSEFGFGSSSTDAIQTDRNESGKIGMKQRVGDVAINTYLAIAKSH